VRRAITLCRLLRTFLQLANLPVQKIDLRRAGRVLRSLPRRIRRRSPLRPAAASSRRRSGSGEPIRARQLGHRPVAFDHRQRHLRPVLPACLLHLPLPRHRRCLGAGLNLNLLSRFRGLAQADRFRFELCTCMANEAIVPPAEEATF
jgi:hypothetical protein